MKLMIAFSFILFAVAALLLVGVAINGRKSLKPPFEKRYADLTMRLFYGHLACVLVGAIVFYASWFAR